MYRMEQDLDTGFSTVCSTCLSSNRNVFPINNLTPVYQIFRLLMYNFVSEEKFDESINEMEQLVCWECMALMKKFAKFKQQVQCVQEHIRVLLSFGTSHENTDHTYLTQSLSSLTIEYKTDYDRIYLDSVARDVNDQQKTTSLATSHKVTILPIHDEIQTELKNFKFIQNNLGVDFSDDIAPENDLENLTDGDMSNSAEKDDFVRCDIFTHSKSNTVQMNSFTSYKRERSTSQSLSESSDDNQNNSCSNLEEPRLDTVQNIKVKTDLEISTGYISEYMTEQEMLASREEAKQKSEYVNARHKCEVCIVGLNSRKEIEDHLVLMHKNKPGYTVCKICYVYVDESKLRYHVNSHYIRCVCRHCGHVEYNGRSAQRHVKSHLASDVTNDVIETFDTKPTDNTLRTIDVQPMTYKTRRKRKRIVKKLTSEEAMGHFKCLDCDKMFQSTKARTFHAQEVHKRGLPCKQCNKVFANKHTLANHVRLHEGPLPKEECPVCHKMVQVTIMKYHILRHKVMYLCKDCNRKFSYKKTYLSHFSYCKDLCARKPKKSSCPRCNKEFTSEEAMQDHLNYTHLRKTAHKCPICDKPLVSRRTIKLHMKRVHGEKRVSVKKYACKLCDKSFTIKKSLEEHEWSHTGERPLSCNLCKDTFRHKAALYTHKRGVHKIAKRVLEYIDPAKMSSSDLKPVAENAVSAVRDD